MRIKAVVAIFLLGAISLAMGVTPAPAAMTQNPLLARLSTLSGRDFDITFMQDVIPMHDESVEIALAATLNADHPDLLRWNQVLIERKKKETRQMINWLNALGGKQPTRGEGVATKPVKQMRQMKGAALEKVYIPMMAARLDQSAAFASLAAKKADKPELRTFAQAAARADSQDAAMLRGWMRKWYH
jgi:uncharacterized protein (DUF305 family)